MTPSLSPLSPQLVPRETTPREKAAIVVRLLLAEGGNLPLSALPDHLQSALTEQMGRMGLVDRATLAAVIADFTDALDAAGMAFPPGIDGALDLMDGHISQTAANRLRRMSSASTKADPWDRIATLPADRLLPALSDESPQVAAVILSKLPVAKAADLLGQLPGERARRIAHAVSRTSTTDPDTVRRIGLALAADLDAQPPRAFDLGPGERVGAILNVSAAQTRDDVLGGLDAEDAAFAAEVRRAIFTFAHIPGRITPRDLPRITRAVDPATLVTALAAPDSMDVAEFILANISPRMAQSLREDIAARGQIAPADVDAATGAIIAAIRQLEAAGELTLLPRAED